MKPDDDCRETAAFLISGSSSGIGFGMLPMQLPVGGVFFFER
jgi:hypothetical protein